MRRSNRRVQGHLSAFPLGLAMCMEAWGGESCAPPIMENQVDKHMKVKWESQVSLMGHLGINVSKPLLQEKEVIIEGKRVLNTATCLNSGILPSRPFKRYIFCIPPVSISCSVLFAVDPALWSFYLKPKTLNQDKP